jgi:hypothetical protein
MRTFKGSKCNDAYPRLSRRWYPHLTLYPNAPISATEQPGELKVRGPRLRGDLAKRELLHTLFWPARNVPPGNLPQFLSRESMSINNAPLRNLSAVSCPNRFHFRRQLILCLCPAFLNAQTVTPPVQPLSGAGGSTYSNASYIRTVPTTSVQESNSCFVLLHLLTGGCSFCSAGRLISSRLLAAERDSVVRAAIRASCPDEL